MLFERLRSVVGRHFDSPHRDLAALCSLVLEPPTEEQLDDALAVLARYLRIDWEYLEEQTLGRVLELLAASNRLITAENGRRPALDLPSEDR